MAAVIEWGEDVETELSRLHRQKQSGTLRLPGGESLFVCRLDQVAECMALLSNPEFGESLERSSREFAGGKGATRAIGQRPASAELAVSEALGSDGLAASLVRATADFAAGAGTARRAGDRPVAK